MPTRPQSTLSPMQSTLNVGPAALNEELPEELLGEQHVTSDEIDDSDDSISNDSSSCGVRIVDSPHIRLELEIQYRTMNSMNAQLQEQVSLLQGHNPVPGE